MHIEKQEKKIIINSIKQKNQNIESKKEAKDLINDDSF